MRTYWLSRLAMAGVALLMCGVAAGIDARQPMPVFRATTLDGQKYSNESVKGKVVLLQFWATWCEYGRGDQDAVDTVAKEFADEGLLVLAVDALLADVRRCPIKSRFQVWLRTSEMVLRSSESIVYRRALQA